MNNITTEYIQERLNSFKKIVETAINTENIDTIIGVPDYIIAQYLYDCLTVYGMSLAAIEKHQKK
jgi:hypothetical protein